MHCIFFAIIFRYKFNIMNSSKIKLHSKMLSSGKCQVKFFATTASNTLYGYLLTEPKASLREVVDKIEQTIEARSEKDVYYHQSLYSLGSMAFRQPEVIVFEG